MLVPVVDSKATGWVNFEPPNINERLHQFASLSAPLARTLKRRPRAVREPSARRVTHHPTPQPDDVPTGPWVVESVTQRIGARVVHHCHVHSKPGEAHSLVLVFVDARAAVLRN